MGWAASDPVRVAFEQRPEHREGVDLLFSLLFAQHTLLYAYSVLRARKTKEEPDLLGVTGELTVLVVCFRDWSIAFFRKQICD